MRTKNHPCGSILDGSFDSGSEDAEAVVSTSSPSSFGDIGMPGVVYFVVTMETFGQRLLGGHRYLEQPKGEGVMCSGEVSRHTRLGISVGHSKCWYRNSIY